MATTIHSREESESSDFPEDFFDFLDEPQVVVTATTPPMSTPPTSTPTTPTSTPLASTTFRNVPPYSSRARARSRSRVTVWENVCLHRQCKTVNCPYIHRYGQHQCVTENQWKCHLCRQYVFTNLCRHKECNHPNCVFFHTPHQHVCTSATCFICRASERNAAQDPPPPY